VVTRILVCSAHTIVGVGRARTEAQALCLHITLPSPDGSQRPDPIQNSRLDSCNEQEPRYPGLPLPTHLGCFSGSRLHFVPRTSLLVPRTSYDAQTTAISSVDPHYDHVPFCGAPYLIRRFSLPQTWASPLGASEQQAFPPASRQQSTTAIVIRWLSSRRART
jgi:hypothetical protein